MMNEDRKGAGDEGVVRYAATRRLRGESELTPPSPLWGRGVGGEGAGALAAGLKPRPSTRLRSLSRTFGVHRYHQQKAERARGYERGHDVTGRIMQERPGDGSTDKAAQELQGIVSAQRGAVGVFRRALAHQAGQERVQGP